MTLHHSSSSTFESVIPVWHAGNQSNKTAPGFQWFPHVSPFPTENVVQICSMLDVIAVDTISWPADVTWGFQVFAGQSCDHVMPWSNSHPKGWEWVQWVQGAQMKLKKQMKIMKKTKKTNQYVRYWSIYINIDHLESRVEMLTGPQQQDCLVATIFWTKPTHPVMVSLVLDRTFAWWLWPHHLWQGRQTVHDWLRWTLLSLLKHIKAY